MGENTVNRNSEKILTFAEINDTVKTLLKKYSAEYAVLFGSYARGEADIYSDIDLVVYGGSKFVMTDIFSFGEELSILLEKGADVYEISEVDTSAPIYRNIIKDGVKIA